MSTTIEPTIGRIVYYRGQDGAIRPAIVVGVNGTFNLDLFVFGQNGMDTDCCFKGHVTHADPDVEPGCVPSWHWMPYQIGQAKKAKDREDVPKAADTYHADIAAEKTLPVSHPVQQLADAVGGTIEHVERLPDGSGAAVMSMPLPTNHWLTQPGYNVPPMVFRKGTDDPARQEWAEKIRAAGRYAVRCATMNGAEDDFDPDALVQNLVVGMLGYFTPDGLSSDADANPPAATIPGTPG
jgi:hypothetical protein